MKYLAELYSAGVACFKAGTFSTKLSTPEQRLASKETPIDATWQRVMIFQGSSTIIKDLPYSGQCYSLTSPYQVFYSPSQP